MIVVHFTPFADPLKPANTPAEPSGQLIRLTESAFNINAAIWTATSSVQVAAIACRTPTLASAAIAIVATVAAGAAIAVVVVEIANLSDLLSKGGELTPADIQKANEILDLMIDPIDELIAVAEGFVTGSQSGSLLGGLLEAIKDARETFAKSSNPFERAAALEEIKDAVSDLFEQAQANPPPADSTPNPQETPPPPSQEPRDFNDFGSEPGPPMAGEPYHDPGTAYV